MIHLLDALVGCRRMTSWLAHDRTRRLAEDRMGGIAEGDHDLRKPRSAQALAGAQVEGHARPSANWRSPP